VVLLFCCLAAALQPSTSLISEFLLTPAPNKIYTVFQQLVAGSASSRAHPLQKESCMKKKAKKEIKKAPKKAV